jgi:plasmid stabilization system protein ParE
MIDRIVDKFVLLAEHSLSGEACDELLRGLSRFSVGNYVFYFRRLNAGQETKEIIRVLHGVRDVDRTTW